MALLRVSALAVVLVLAGLSLPAVSLADPAPAHNNMQGDQSSWINDPHMHGFYDLTVRAFANGPAHLDRAKFENDARDIFRAFAIARGMKPEMMLEHLKLIPGQVIQIATDDPKVLTSYDTFVAAVFGPQ